MAAKCARQRVRNAFIRWPPNNYPVRITQRKNPKRSDESGRAQPEKE